MPRCLIVVLTKTGTSPSGSSFSIGLSSCAHVCVTQQSADVTLAWPFKSCTLFERACSPQQSVRSEPQLSWSVQTELREPCRGDFHVFFRAAVGVGWRSLTWAVTVESLSPEVREQWKNSDTLPATKKTPCPIICLCGQAELTKIIK